VPARVVVLVSGSGTLLQALLDATAAPDHPVRVVAVGADRGGIAGIDRAAQAGVPTFVVEPGAHADRDAWGEALWAEVAAHEPDWVLSAGFMRILPSGFVRAFPNRVLNTHPALPAGIPRRPRGARRPRLGREPDRRLDHHR